MKTLHLTVMLHEQPLSLTSRTSRTPHHERPKGTDRANWFNPSTAHHSLCSSDAVVRTTCQRTCNNHAIALNVASKAPQPLG
jgi:hypothetical protein